MKVLLLSGSPHVQGSTYRALQEISDVLVNQKIDCEYYQLPLIPLQSCLACGYCKEQGTNRCKLDDCVNEIIAKMADCDGLIVGSPVHFAGITGACKIVLDRLFYCARPIFSHKAFAAVVIARRAGTTAALEQLNKYPLIANMVMVGSQYWPMVFGAEASDLSEDEEGLQTMRTLGRNFAWILKAIEAANSQIPQAEAPSLRTNFVRQKA